MWRLTYLLLLLVRVYFALSPSYLHPDENFQGPEVIAGHLFPYPSRRTWEWTVAKPIRSVFPLWPVYGLPMVLLQWTSATDEEGTVNPAVIYYTLRMVMFILSFVLEDWAIHDLVHSPRYRKQAVILVASSYVTWTFQTHTFSNSVETLLVLWSLVLIERIVGEEKRSSIASSVLLGFLVVFGTFNRITFPAFVLIPGMRLLPHFFIKPWNLIIITSSALFWTCVAVATDTAFYTGPAATASFRTLFDYVRTVPVITPINNVLYNTKTSNLADHGLHPHYQHFLVNLPQFLGPALILLLLSVYPFTPMRLKAFLTNSRLSSATTATLILSIIPHQEPRFLLPCVPLLLTCLPVLSSLKLQRLFWTTWIVFNLSLGVLMGTYHQGGIIPAQLALPSLIQTSLNTTHSNAHNIEVFYWKTYPPPLYLLGGAAETYSSKLNATITHIHAHTHPRTNASLNISTVPLMGMSQPDLVFMLMQHFPTCDPSLIQRLTPHEEPTDVFVAAPFSAWRLPEMPDFNPANFSFSIAHDHPRAHLSMTNIATFKNHINLDDMDVGEDGLWETVKRVVGRRGLGVWRVGRICYYEYE